MKIFALRFDIDSVVGLKYGVPAILDMAKHVRVHFSFFVNMGKGVPLSRLFLNFFYQGNFNARKNIKIDIIRKYGFLKVLLPSLLNLDVGLADRNILNRIIDEGHELGLHGGLGHVKWQENFNKMDSREINRSFEGAYQRFTKWFEKPLGFTSPGFRSNSFILNLLDKYGFLYSSDVYGEDFSEPLIIQGYNQLSIPVNIIGPRTSPFVEWCYINNYSDKEVVEAVANRVVSKNVSILYGHPYFEGIKVHVLEKILSYALSSGYAVKTLWEIAKIYLEKFGRENYSVS